jgi:hypothetical protein
VKHDGAEAGRGTGSGSPVEVADGAVGRSVRGASFKELWIDVAETVGDLNLADFASDDKISTQQAQAKSSRWRLFR